MNGTLRIHLDPVGGIAGDMFVAALLDAFPDLVERVLADVARVLPPEAGRARLSEGASSAVRALRFRLDGPHDGHPGHHHAQADDEGHDHGRYPDLVRRIDAAGLSPGTADEASAILEHLARAEAHIHGCALEEVHFHEIADWDSLMDVVAAGSIAAALPTAQWTVAALPRGGGLVQTQHGLLPVPAPATAELLAGFDWRDDGISGERVTPTGAAILRHLVRDPSGRADGRLFTTGCGAGTRALPGMPNILRTLVFEPVLESALQDEVAVLSFDVDDMTGEEIATAADRLRAVAGVRDLAIAALSGKKGRPLQGFRLLVEPALLEQVKLRCFAETSTIGLRWHVEQRDLLARSSSETRDGVRVKTVRRPGGGMTSKPESDDLLADSLAGRRALAAGIPGKDTP